VASLAPELLERLRGWRERGLSVFVEILVGHGGGRLAGDAEIDELVRFASTLREHGGARDVVVSFDGAPLDLEDLADIDRYGRSAAPAHLDLVRAVERSLPQDTRVWMRPTVSSDAGLDDPKIGYSKALLDGLARLPRRVGIVWSGTAPASPTLDAAAVHRTSTRLGGRKILLADRFPANGSGLRLPLALVLGPLRGRAADLGSELAGYVSIPMAELGGSRLSLLTVADYLRDPKGYDPDKSRRKAIERLAGPDPAVREALDTQTIEWGGFIGTRNYHTADTDNPQRAAEALSDPAALAAWTWVVRRYPERMAAIARADDKTFAADVTRTMARRLAVAEAAPLVAEVRRGTGSKSELEATLGQLRSQRAKLADKDDVRLALDRFLAHAGVRLPGEKVELEPVPETPP
jgi:beta-N-acetylglucosaminidase-like protein